jgi:tetratricopeptide (TPR) repeat protein
VISQGLVYLSRLPVLALCGLLVALVGPIGCGSDEDRLGSFMERGDAYVEEGEFEEAIIEYKNVLQIDPNHAGAHEALSLAYLEVKKPREAYWEMSETVRLAPENVDAKLRYGTVAAAVGDFDLALEQADAVLKLEPNSPQGHTLRAQAREAKEDFEGAEEDFEAAVAADPKGAAYRFLLGGFLERRGRTEEAERVARDLMDLEESYLAASNLARMVMSTRDQDEEAERLLDRSVELALEAPVEAVERGPDTEAGTTSLVPNITRAEAMRAAYLVLSAFHYDRGRFERSIEVLEEGVEQAEPAVKTALIYQMARLYRMHGDAETADQLLHRATTAAPDEPAPQLVLSAFLGSQGDLDGALEAARKAVEIAPENRPARLREAELLVDIGYRDNDPASIDAGRAIVDSVLEEEPSSPEAHFVRAKIELAENDLSASVESLETVLQARPDFAQARFVLGSALAVRGEIGRARVELARAIEIDPTMKDARKLLTKVHAELGEHEFAIEQGRIYLQQVPSDSEIRIIVGQSLIRVGRGDEAYEEVSKIPEAERGAAAYFALGRLDLAFGRVDLGIERLNKAEELSPGNPQVLRTLMAVDRQRGSLDQSVARIEKAIEANPESAELQELLGEARMLGGDLEGGKAALERAVELDARNTSAQLALADLARRAGDTQQAIVVLEQAATAMPTSSELQYQLALNYERVGRSDEAIAAYEKAISLDADLFQAKNNLAYLLAESGGDLDRALELAQEAKEQLPDDPNAADTLGWVLVKRGVPSAAIGYLEEAAERFPDSALEVQGIVRNHLAEAYEQNAQAEKALESSRASLEYYDKLVRAASQQGVEVGETDWVREARARIDRLEAAAS